jgi:hypothetical protein
MSRCLVKNSSADATDTSSYGSSDGAATRYSDSAGPFFRDMLQTPDLSPPETEAVCRVLLDLPDRWRGASRAGCAADDL